MRFKLSVSLALVASVGAYPAAAAHAAAKKPAPRLVVLSVKAAPSERKPLHRFVNGEPFKLLVTIKNVGTGAIAKSASREGVLESHQSGALSYVKEATFKFSRLRPRETQTVEVLALGREPDSRDVITTAVPKACVPQRGNADFNAQGTLKGRVSCAQGPGFAVIPKRWTGTMSVTRPIFGFATMETDAIPTFTYDASVSAHTDKFVYGGTGDLVHSVSGSSAFCSVTGGKNGKIAPGEAFLTLDPSLLDYSGGMTTAEVYEATQTCEGESIQTPIRTDGIKIPVTDRLDESETKLVGALTELTLSFKWDLDAVT